MKIIYFCARNHCIWFLAWSQWEVFRMNVEWRRKGKIIVAFILPKQQFFLNAKFSIWNAITQTNQRMTMIRILTHTCLMETFHSLNWGLKWLPASDALLLLIEEIDIVQAKCFVCDDNNNKLHLIAATNIFSNFIWNGFCIIVFVEKKM